VAAALPDEQLDRCRYSRRFVPEFQGCAAFTPVEFVPFDTQYRTLAPVITCRHLDVGENADGAYYPRCALGDVTARRAWVAQIGPERLQVLRALSLEYRAWLRPILAAVWEHKARALAARGSDAPAGSARDELESAVDRLLEAADAWIEQHRERLSSAGLEPAALRSLVRQSTRAWAESPTAGVDYRIPDDLLARFPAPVQAFIKAGR
jgi:hypothetical protein